VGPVPQGVSKFVLTAEAPNVNLIPMKDLVGVTVVLITCSYREKEFVRIGYYVNNEYYHASPLDYQRQATQAASHHAAAVSQAEASGLPPPPPPALPEGPQPASEEEIAAMLESGQIIDPVRVYRNVMSDKPRVTRFQIDWASAAQQQLQQQQVRRFLSAPFTTHIFASIDCLCLASFYFWNIAAARRDTASGAAATGRRDAGPGTHAARNAVHRRTASTAFGPFCQGRRATPSIRPSLHGGILDRPGLDLRLHSSALSCSLTLRVPRSVFVEYE